MAQRSLSALTAGTPRRDACRALLQGHRDPPPASGSLFSLGGHARAGLIKKLSVH